ncbi:hypothetical protein MTR62_05260 [Novosphingobium sp. 1949]|uniref:Uncharacterized protein n=1 Tax=Novosphingobium organovorum TaxID=2930092 RepID=A0ABT0BAQ6_9SPHN|nr:hypothetical protein [Novosphingobium organovorum]MCJ2182113.1 hypothetical protein [Novosphingobium organovorum]
MILEGLLLIVLCCTASEVFLRLPIAPRVAHLAGIGRSASRVLLSRRISDHWKERVMPRHALRMGLGTAVLAGWFALFAALIGALAWAADQLEPGFAEELTTLPGLVVCFSVSGAYLFMRHTLRGCRA